MSYSQYSFLEISYRLKRNYDSLSKRVLIFLDNILLRYTKCCVIFCEHSIHLIFRICNYIINYIYTIWSYFSFKYIFQNTSKMRIYYFDVISILSPVMLDKWCFNSCCEVVVRCPGTPPMSHSDTFPPRHSRHIGGVSGWQVGRLGVAPALALVGERGEEGLLIYLTPVVGLHL